MWSLVRDDLYRRRLMAEVIGVELLLDYLTHSSAELSLIALEALEILAGGPNAKVRCDGFIRITRNTADDVQIIRFYKISTKNVGLITPMWLIRVSIIYFVPWSNVFPKVLPFCKSVGRGVICLWGANWCNCEGIIWSGGARWCKSSAAMGGLRLKWVKWGICKSEG